MSEDTLTFQLTDGSVFFHRHLTDEKCKVCLIQI